MGPWPIQGRNSLSATTPTILSNINENDPRFLHVQAFVTARLTGPDMERVGAGVLEQLILGPHAPSGFKDSLDPAL